MNIKMVTVDGIEHGLINETANSVKDPSMNRFKEKDRPEMEKLRKHQCTMVTVEYINTKNPAGKLERPYLQWNGETVKHYRFLNGYTYTIPQGLVDEVNESFVAPEREGKLVDNVPLKADKKGIREHRFIKTGK